MRKYSFKKKEKTMESRKKHLLAIALTAMTVIAPSAAFADISGHTDLAFGGFGSWSGTNNWAVLDPGSALRAALTAIGFTAGTGSGGWGNVQAGDYIYLYQETNDASSSVVLSQFTQNLGLPGLSQPVSPRVWGQFTGLVMQDAGGNVSPTNDLDVITGIVGAGGLTAASTVSLSAGAAGSPGSLIANWGTGSPLMAGGTGALFVFASPLAPGVFTGSLQDGGAAVFGASPAPIPSPGAVVLGLMGLTSLVLRRRTA
jgi:hypothetical protein